MSQKRAAAYVRVSTDRQAKEGLSLDEQKRRVEAHIAAQGWTLADTYVEAGVSGRKDDRPALRRLLADASASCTRTSTASTRPASRS
jgi:site-specific DNA recombinase